MGRSILNSVYLQVGPDLFPGAVHPSLPDLAGP